MGEGTIQPEEPAKIKKREGNKPNPQEIPRGMHCPRSRHVPVEAPPAAAVAAASRAACRAPSSASASASAATYTQQLPAHCHICCSHLSTGEGFRRNFAMRDAIGRFGDSNRSALATPTSPASVVSATAASTAAASAAAAASAGTRSRSAASFFSARPTHSNPMGDCLE